MNSLAQLMNSLDKHRARKKWYRRWCQRSSVAIILREGDQGLEVLMIKRAEREGDPWSGHMAFPGGRMELVDAGGLATAQRETHEEIGLADNQYSDCVGRLSDIHANMKQRFKPMIISCFVFAVDEIPELNLNYEVADVIWVPLRFIADHSNRQTMQWQRNNKKPVTLPCYFYQQQRIWGLSLMMLDELVSVIKR